MSPASSHTPLPSEPFRFALPPSLGEVKAAERAGTLQAFLEEVLARPVEVRVPPSYDALAKELLSGRVDAIWGPPFVCARLEAMGVRVLVRGIRGGQASYRAALVCRKEAPLSLDGLAGHTAAWVDRDSVGGYLLAVAHLRSKRLEPAKLFFRQRFVGTYEAALRAVLDGEETLTSVYAPASPSEGQPETGADDVLPGASDGLKVLALTDASPNDGIALSMELSPELTRSLETAFLGMAKGPHQATLAEVFNLEGFEPAPRMGYRALYRVSLASL